MTIDTKAAFSASLKEASRRRHAIQRALKKPAPIQNPPPSDKKPNRPAQMSQGELYAYHKRNGTLAIYYQLYPDDAPET